MEDSNEAKPEKVEEQVKEMPKEEVKSNVEREKTTKPQDTKNQISNLTQEKKPEKKEPKQEKPKIKKDYVLPFMTSSWYDKNYKKLLIVWIIISILIIANLVFMYVSTGDVMQKDVSLTGGTTISIYTDQQIDSEELSSSLFSKLNEDVFVRTLTDLTSGKQVAIVVETKADSNVTKTAIEQFLGYELNTENSTTEVSGSNLSSSFYKQLIIALAIAFLLMGITVFIIFKKTIPSLAVIQCGLFDTLGALVIANLFGIRISTAGIAALLMLIGYSVDTDILLTTKVLKRKGEDTLNNQIHSAFKTGIIMTLSSLVAVLLAYFIVSSPVLKQIFFILSAGLFVDILGTWIGNASILKWYCEKKGLN